MTEPHVIACLDAAYDDDAAGVACALFDRWESPVAAGLVSKHISLPPAAYEPGSFYKRELPLLREILSAVVQPIATIIIDGYVWLGDDEKPGLGAILYRALEEKYRLSASQKIGSEPIAGRFRCCAAPAGGRYL